MKDMWCRKEIKKYGMAIVERMRNKSLVRKIRTSTTEGTGRIGRPRERWIHALKASIRARGISVRID